MLGDFILTQCHQPTNQLVSTHNSEVILSFLKFSSEITYKRGSGKTSQLVTTMADVLGTYISWLCNAVSSLVRMHLQNLNTSLGLRIFLELFISTLPQLLLCCCNNNFVLCCHLSISVYLMCWLRVGSRDHDTQNGTNQEIRIGRDRKMGNVAQISIYIPSYFSLTLGRYQEKIYPKVIEI